ncbi:MAG: nucleotidyltransferase family protein [Acidimicrobiales bacterium]
MADSLAAVVLGAGAGERLRPLTWLRPKVLCPVAGVPLVDHNLARVATITGSLAVNVHHGRRQLEDHLADLHPEVHVSIEPDRPLGTAGAIVHLRDWVDGRPVVVVNGDAWSEVALAPLVAGWEGVRVRVLVPGGSARLGPTAPVAGTLLPGPVAAALGPEPAGLYASVWAPAAAAGRLELVAGSGRFVDCGTPASYLAANLAASGGRPVVGDRAVVEPGATLARSVVWPGAVVRASEVLVDAVRADRGVTVLVRPAGPRSRGSP